MNSNKIKLTFLAPNLMGGGAERVTARLAAHFSQDNQYQLDLLLLKAEGPYLNDLPDGINIIELNCSKALYALPKLINYLRKNKPDILFTSQIHISTIALAAINIARVKTRAIVRQPSMLKPAYKKESLNLKLRRSIFLKLALKADRVIVSSKNMKSEFLDNSKISREKIKVIYNPLPIEQITNRSLEPIEHNWFLDSDIPVIIAVGRLVTVKDFETLIKAFNIVKKRKNARLVILGEGPLRLELQKLVEYFELEDSVLMPGFSDNPFKYMRNSKVYVLSSLWEGFPNSMVEAMVCNTTIVATNCEGAASEILEYGKLGKLVPVKSPEHMADAIIESLESIEPINYSNKLGEFLAENIYKKYSCLFNS